MGLRFNGFYPLLTNNALSGLWVGVLVTSAMILSVLIGQKFRKFNLLDIPQAYIMTVIYAVLVIGFGGFIFIKKTVHHFKSIKFIQ